MGSNSYFIADSIKPLLEQGLLTEADIDRKVVNIYTPCFEVGFSTVLRKSILSLSIARYATGGLLMQPARVSYCSKIAMPHFHLPHQR